MTGIVRRVARTIVAVAIVGLAAVQARAELSFADSVEWLACKAEVIVVGKVASVAETKEGQSTVREDCVVTISEVIKGDVKDQTLRVRLTSYADELKAKGFLKSERGCLFLLTKRKPVTEDGDTDLGYVPSSARHPLSVFDLSDVPKGVYSKSMTILKEPKEILDLVRVWTKSPIRESLRVEVTDPVMYGEMYGGSACYLIVPAEESWRAHFLKLARSDEAYEREKAASELWKFPGDETESVLRKLLADTSEYEAVFSADYISRFVFGVRAAAYASLKALGKPVPEKIELERKPTLDEQRTLRRTYWTAAFTEALSGGGGLGWKVVSVEDGGMRRLQDRDTTAVVVTCGAADARCRFTLVPKEWDTKDRPAGENLGINGRNSQGARWFLLADGTVPLKVRIVAYFGLEKP